MGMAWCGSSKYILYIGIIEFIYYIRYIINVVLLYVVGMMGPIIFCLDNIYFSTDNYRLIVILVF